MSSLFELARDGGKSYRWPIDPRWCSWNGLWGGALIGSALTALEAAAERPVRAMNVQFISPVGSTGELLIHPELRVMGRAIAQAAVQVSWDGALALSAGAVMGEVRGPVEAPARPPAVPDPDSCPEKVWMNPSVGGLRKTVETRIALVHPMGTVFWVRCTIASRQALTSAVVTALSDMPAAALGASTEGRAYEITLDASLRLFEPVEHEPGDAWLLVEVCFDGLAQNLAFATAKVWLGERLLAICGQTLRLRSR